MNSKTSGSNCGRCRGFALAPNTRSHLINRSCGTVVPDYPIGGTLT